MARVNFTAGRIAAFQCSEGKHQAFLWDAKAPGLALRVTAHGARSYVFQSRLQDGGALRMTIGDPASWSIPRAQEEARRLQGLIDQGKDPRVEKSARAAKDAEQRARAQALRVAQRAEQRRREVTGLDAWAAYCHDRRQHWGGRYYADHVAMASEGGAPHKRSKKAKKTQPGALYSLLAGPLVGIDAGAVERWVSRETKSRPRTASFGFGMLRTFLRWCSERDEYRSIVVADACGQRRTVQKLAKRTAKKDVLQREQLRAWFAEVRKLPEIQAAYLQTVLLTGCRPGEALELRWTDVDFKWRSLRIRDKVEGERVIPLTPYVAELLGETRVANDRVPKVPRRLRSKPEEAEEFRRAWKPSPWVFASRQAEAGHITKANKAHQRALTTAGLPHVSQHGLRRSFGTLAEWVECPVGIVAQIQGHKPSAIAEKHYRVRPLDLLRMWHSRIEAWILSEADIEVPKAQQSSEPRALRVVAGTST